MSLIVEKGHSAHIIPRDDHGAIRSVARSRHRSIRTPRFSNQISFICIHYFQRLSTCCYENLKKYS